ncbi:MAG: hypothetical protein CFH10_00707 [Alphaproteobacteria bacterium MarineAlpha4_Bin2]|nr:MAG: hypothetical protein CFH10_00707 [Alphaproteobacteria bacterium MarineAlpha4_Bin2]
MQSNSVLESMYNSGGQIRNNYYPKTKLRFHRALRTAMHLYRSAWRSPVLELSYRGGFQVETFWLFGMRPCGIDIEGNSISYVRNNFEKSNFYCKTFDKFSSRALEFNITFLLES